MACLSSATVAFFATKTSVESKQKKDQCQNSINFKHITKLLFFSFLLFPNTIKKQEQWVCIYEAKNKIFSKNYNI